MRMFVVKIPAGTSVSEPIKIAGASRGGFQLPPNLAVQDEEQSSGSSSSESTSSESRSSASSLSSQSTSSQSISTSSSSLSESSLSSSSSSSTSSISTSSLSESSESSSHTFGTIDFKVRCLPTSFTLTNFGQDENDWPWVTPVGADGSVISGLSYTDIEASECRPFPDGVFSYSQVRMDFGAIQDVDKAISVYLDK